MTELTAGEQAYLDSGGTNAAGLLEENPAPAKVETPAGEHKIEPDKPAARPRKAALTGWQP